MMNYEGGNSEVGVVVSSILLIDRGWSLVGKRILFHISYFYNSFASAIGGLRENE